MNKLTQEQIKSFPTFVKKWLEIGLATGRADRPTAERLVRDVYELSGLEPPQKFIWRDSPYQGTIEAYDQVYDSDQVYGQVRYQVYNQVYDQVGDQVSDQVSRQVNDQVSDQVYDQVYGQVYNQVKYQVYDQVRNQVRNQVQGNLDHTLSFYDFFLQNGAKNIEKIVPQIELAKQIGVWWAFEKTAILSERPKILIMHNQKLKKIQYFDDWGFEVKNGIRTEIRPNGIQRAVKRLSKVK